MSNWLDYKDHFQHRLQNVHGILRVHPKFHSPQLDNERDIVVYLPPSYRSKTKRYPVLYIHDGQNLFDENASFAGEWGVDETMERLAAEGLEAIVVGIPNMGLKRLAEYSPMPDEKLGGGDGAKYVSFIADTLKPLIDLDARTLADPKHTGILGSSMGGLISLYAFFQRPELFGFAGILSPSLWYAKFGIMDYVKRAQGNAGKIYLSVGRREYTHLSSEDKKFSQSKQFVAHVRRLRRNLVKKGYRPVHQLRYVEERKGRHNEVAWRRNFEGAVRFFLENCE